MNKDEAQQMNRVTEFIAQAEEIVFSQQKRIERLNVAGCDTTQAQAFLTLFVETLKNLRTSRMILSKNLEALID